MWKWPAFAGVLLLFVLALGLLLFRGTPAQLPPPPPLTRAERVGDPPAPTEERAIPTPDAKSRSVIPPPDPIAAAATAASRGETPDPPPVSNTGSERAPSNSPSGSNEPGAEGPPVEHHTWPSDAAGIRGAVRESIPELKHCYEEWQKTSPELRGKIAIGFTISSDLEVDAGIAPVATVSAVRIGESELDHVFMEGCVKSVFSELRFEPPTDGKLDVTYPIQFDTVEDPPK